MNIQIFGTKKCFDTKKAERYFKERKIKYQFIDLTEKAISKGELQSIRKSLTLNALINIKSREYEKSNLKNIRGDEVKEEILLKNPKLFVTPIVRNGKEATVGYEPEVWKKWE
jgi:arsenate reductase